MKWFGGNEGPGGDGGVVDLNETQRQRHYAPLAQIEGYWNALRGTRVMPQRSEIDPRGLRGTLEYCFVLERVAPGLARLRVAGSHLADLMGMEVRGMPISAFLDSDSRQQFGMALEEVFEGPGIATIDLHSERGLGRPELLGRMVLMPVRSDLGDASRILGGFITEGDPGRAPRKFRVTKIDLREIAGRAPVPIQAAGTERPAPSFSDPDETAPAIAAEDAARFEQVLPDVPYLKIVR